MSGSVTQGGTLDGDLDLDCDVVVVGSGAGGMVVAAELAEAGHDVVILEEGRYYTPEEYGAMRPSESMRHLWRDGALTFVAGLDDSPMINVTMGRAVGGSSVLTGGVCFRTPGYILDDWDKRLGLTELNEAAMDPYFSAVEKSVHVEEVPISMRSKSTQMFARGAEKRGFSLKPLRRNTKDCNGCGRCNFGCPHGAKLSVDAAYLPRALAAGARLYSECFVDRVTSDGARATGVTGRLTRGAGRRKTGRLTVRARRVVVAAGSYFSPGILARSGVGKQSGQLGKNMTLHPGFRMMARFDEKLEGWKGALQSAYSDEFESDHITMVGLFIPPGVIAATMKGVGPKHLEKARGVPPRRGLRRHDSRRRRRDGAQRHGTHFRHL